ncbi:MAG: SpoIIE family protein phosphatase [Leptospiraceae bacterium]|nr:SpoIIE family protein phosphatase [Leptospiraceae bacterium]
MYRSQIEPAGGQFRCTLSLAGGAGQTQHALPDGLNGQFWTTLQSSDRQDVFVLSEREGVHRLLVASLTPGLRVGRDGEEGPELIDGDPTGLFSMEEWAQYFTADYLAMPYPGDALNRLGKRAYNCGVVLKATVLDFPDQSITDLASDTGALKSIPGYKHALEAGDLDASILVMDLATAGLPAMMLVRAGRLSFPSRSWYPAGIMPDWSAHTQSLEGQAGDRIVIFTDIPNESPGLKVFHRQIQSQSYLSADGLAPATVLEIQIESRT